MNTASFHDRERLDELLADEASAALDSGEVTELESLLARNPRVPRDELLQAAALTQLAFLRRAPTRTVTRMPSGLKERLASQGRAIAGHDSAPVPAARVVPVAKRPATPRKTGTTVSLANGLGWALAAMLAVALVLVRTGAPVVAPDAVAARITLLNSAPDAITLPWAPPEAEGYRTVTGDVVWSPSRQQGYLRLANMPVNDPARTQYQLWIVDPERDTHPVDGGVFNVSSAGEVVIPIQAKLSILAPRAFAITAERPGGVVVSAGPLLVVASS